MTIGGCPKCGQHPEHAISCPLGWGQTTEPTTTFHPVQPEGVWAIVDRDMGETITKVYPTEIAALRELNGRGYGRVRFVPFGQDLHDLDTEEAHLAELRQKLSEHLPSDAGGDSNV